MWLVLLFFKEGWLRNGPVFSLNVHGWLFNFVLFCCVVWLVTSQPNIWVGQRKLFASLSTCSEKVMWWFWHYLTSVGWGMDLCSIEYMLLIVDFLFFLLLCGVIGHILAKHLSRHKLFSSLSTCSEEKSWLILALFDKDQLMNGPVHSLHVCGWLLNFSYILFLFLLCCKIRHISANHFSQKVQAVCICSSVVRL